MKTVTIEGEVIDVEAEVITPEQTADATQPFPLQVKPQNVLGELTGKEPEEALKTLGEVDPGQFMQALAGLGLKTGKIVSLMLKNALKGRRFERGEVASISPDGIALQYINKPDKFFFMLKDIQEVEVLHAGQRFPLHEFEFKKLGQGLTAEELEPHLKELTAGEAVVVRDEEGAVKGKIRLYRDDNNELASFIKRPAEKLEIKDIEKFGIVWTDEQRKELMETGKLEHPVIGKANGKEIEFAVSVDKDVNQLELKRIHRKMNQSQSAKKENRIALEKGKLIDLTKALKGADYPDAWVELKEAEKGISLHKAPGVFANLVFEKKGEAIVPKLNVWYQGDAGVGRAAYMEQFEKAVTIAQTFLDGGDMKQYQKQSTNNESKSEAKKESTGEKKKHGNQQKI